MRPTQVSPFVATFATHGPRVPVFRNMRAHLSAWTSTHGSETHERISDLRWSATVASFCAEKFPKSWLFHYRWTRKQASKDHAGNTVVFLTVGSRTSAVVPSLQKMGGYGTKVVEVEEVKKSKGRGVGKGRRRKGEETDVVEEVVGVEARVGGSEGKAGSGKTGGGRKGKAGGDVEKESEERDAGKNAKKKRASMVADGVGEGGAKRGGEDKEGGGDVGKGEEREAGKPSGAFVRHSCAKLS